VYNIYENEYLLLVVQASYLYDVSLSYAQAYSLTIKRICFTLVN